MKPRFCGIHFFNPPRYMYLVELINTPTTDAHILDDLETFVTSGLGKGVVRAKDTPNFIANRVGIAGMLSTHARSGEVRPDLRRGRRPDRQEDGPRQLGHLPHRGHRGPGHHGPRDQDAAGHAERRRPIRSTRASPPPKCSRRCWRKATWGRRPRPASTRGPAATCCGSSWPAGDYVPAGQKADEVYGRMLKKPPAERLKLLRNAEGRAGPVPVGHPAQQLPLRGRAPGHDRGNSARRGLRLALGLRHEAGPVRALAGGRLAAGRAVDPGGHRRRQGAVAARRCPSGCSRARWRRPAACTRPRARGIRPRRSSSRAGCCRCIRASISPRPCWAARRSGFETAGTTLHEDDAIRLWTLDDEVRHRQHQDQDARHQPGGVPRACRWPSTWPRSSTRDW